MPKGYLIAHVTVRDPEAYLEYVRRDTPIFESFGGRFLVRGGESDVVEGESFQRHVVIEFPDYAAAQACYHSKDYQEVAEIRRATASSVLILAEGT